MLDMNVLDEDNGFLDNAESDDKNAKSAEDAMTDSFQLDTFTYSTSGSVVNTDIESIMNTLGDGTCIVPGFQRKFVWKKEQVAGLAFSILKGIPVPPIYVYFDDEDGNEVILDGHQRLTAVFMYFHGLYFSSETRRKKIDFIDVQKKMSEINEIDGKINAGDTTLKEARKDLLNYLKENYELVQTEYEVKGDNGEKRDITFSSLSEREKKILKRKALQFAVVQCARGAEPQKFYTMVFKMLNSGGKNLGPQEIRNGLYWKTMLYNRLFAVNEGNAIWRAIYGNISLYSKDVELLLKMLALDYFTECTNDGKVVINYAGTFNWNNIMMSYSEEAKQWNEEMIEKEVSNIDAFLSHIELDVSAKKCKKAALEAVYIASCKLAFDFKDFENQKIKMSWLVSLSDQEEIFGDGKVLSNKNSVQQRLTKTLPIVREEYGNYSNCSKKDSN